MIPASRLSSLASVLLLLILWAAPALADEQPARVSLAPMDVGQFPELQTTVAVLNRSNVPVTGLTKEDVELVEDGKTVPVTAIEQVATNPASVAVILGLDVSGSMQGKPLADAVAAITGFVDRLAPGDQVVALTFGGTSCAVNRGPGTTNDKGAANEFLRGAKAVGDTPLYDATLTAVQAALSAPPGRRMVVILTDGEDTCSKVSADTAVAAAVREGIPLYFIGLGPELKPAVLQNLANLTGGQYLAAEDSSKLAAIYEALNARLRTQYFLRYRSAQLADRKEHVTLVRVKTDAGEAAGEIRWKPPVILPDPALSLAPSQKIDKPTPIEVTTRSPVQLVRADFYLDNTLLQTVAQPPLAYTIDPSGLASGPRSIRVRVADAGGGEAETSVTVEFASGGIPPWALLAVVLALPALAVVGVFLLSGRRSLRCPNCRRKLKPGWTACPYCARPEPIAGPTRPVKTGEAPPPAVQSVNTSAPPPTSTGEPPTGIPRDPAGTIHPRATQILNAPAKPAAWLVVKSGEHRGTRFRVNDGETTIGRDGANDVALDDTAATLEHAKLRLIDGAYYLTDLDTTNGTLVNGRRIVRQRLKHGDEVTIGETTLVFMLLDSSQ